MLMAARQKATPYRLYDKLMSTRRGEPIEDSLARMLASWSVGIGDMPKWLGLEEKAFRYMMDWHFPLSDPDEFAMIGKKLDPDRMDEMEDLHKLLIQSRSGRSDSELWMAEIVIAGCLGSDHLWQDLGLWQRADLSRLMLENFEPLARQNDKDMKWKKFLYKQLCEAEGIYTCRSPSCEVCRDYEHCFGPED